MQERRSSNANNANPQRLVQERCNSIANAHPQWLVQERCNQRKYFYFL